MQERKPSTSDKTWILTGAIAYVVLSFIFAGFVIFQSVDCIEIENDDKRISECIEEVDSKAAPFEAMFSLVQLAGGVGVIILLVRHNSRRNEMGVQQTPESQKADSDDKQPK